MYRPSRQLDLCNSSRRGFTLFEVLITTGIMAILGAVIVASMAPEGGMNLEAAARILVSDLTYARSLSIQYNTKWAVQFDAANNRYNLVYAGTGAQPVLLTNSRAAGDAPSSTYQVNLASQGASTVGTNGVTFAGAGLQGTTTMVTDVTFGPLGGTGPTRTQDTVIWLTTGTGSSTQYVRLTVSWVTGQVWVDRPSMFTTSAAVLQ